MPAVRATLYSPAYPNERPEAARQIEQFSRPAGELPPENAGRATAEDFIPCLRTLLAASVELTCPAAFNTMTATSSDPLVATITARPEAPIGEDRLVVMQLAQAHKIITRPFTSGAAALGFAGTLAVNGRAITIGITDTLAGVAAKINAAGVGAIAAVVALGPSDTRLTLTSTTPGLAGGLAITGVMRDEFAGDVAIAQDARFSLDGAEFTRPGNVIGDILPGVSITLLSSGAPQAPATSLLSISRDTDTAVKALNSFASIFNEVRTFADYYASEFETSGDTPTSEAMPGETIPLDQEMLARLRESLDATLEISSNGCSLDLIGAARDKRGLLEVDGMMAAFVLKTDPAFVMRLFGARDMEARGVTDGAGIATSDMISGRLHMVSHGNASNGAPAPETHGILAPLITALRGILCVIDRSSLAEGDALESQILEIKSNMKQLNALAAAYVGQLRQAYSTMEERIVELESRRLEMAA